HAGHGPSAPQPGMAMPASGMAMPMEPPPASRVPGIEPHTRVGSGTSWQPDSTPMYAVHRQSGPWGLMFHGNLFGLYDHQGSARGATRVISVNCGMVMAERSVGRGHLMLRGMFSLEPATIRPRGYP